MGRWRALGHNKAFPLGHNSRKSKMRVDGKVVIQQLKRASLVRVVYKVYTIMEPLSNHFIRPDFVRARHPPARLPLT
jgi:hypothetical protein